ncbi:hypothetical protein [Neptuniibacter sp. 1_MG-2023]|uniref:hypothetical protein n=1 Tax=Neptuniibacter sp. 1_MG-2023 TaxID=3062662 RepID=UPI0026E48B77|nr:hypothetical protein [Neptuniibacter sp. 1_MG-2023]MDO6594680.1 hypothetical protein [Neptuniibacter sp. 1_MG-2023]
MKLLFEKTYPYLFGIIACVLWWQSKSQFPTSDAIISSTLSVSGIFVGFLATSKAILISMNSPLINDLKDSGYINELVSYIGQAIWLNLAFCTLDVIGYFSQQSASWYSILWVGLSVASLSAFIRVTHIMLQIFKHS